MQQSSRVDYDAIAELYDSQPHPEKSADPELVAFLGERGSSDRLSLLDIACGTGSQLIANRVIAPDAWMVGLDGSLGMLRQARRKAPDIAWVYAVGGALPFRRGIFDFVSCQYAFHHFRDKTGMLRDGFRALRAGGRLTIHNLCPHDCEDWLYYLYFPEALGRDLADFWPPEPIVREMEATGFTNVATERRHLRFEHDLSALLEAVRRRDTNSQLMAISDVSYAAGLRSIERELAKPSAPRAHPDHLCFVTVSGDKPARVG